MCLYLWSQPCCCCCCWAENDLRSGRGMWTIPKLDVWNGSWWSCSTFLLMSRDLLPQKNLHRSFNLRKKIQRSRVWIMPRPTKTIFLYWNAVASPLRLRWLQPNSQQLLFMKEESLTSTIRWRPVLYRCAQYHNGCAASLNDQRGASKWKYMMFGL